MKTSAKFARQLRQRYEERGATMVLVAVGLSFMIIAVAALAIDLVALYSAHNDARLAADAAALAGAKVIANSGYTTDTQTTTWAAIAPIAKNVATATAIQNKIGGQPIKAANVTVTPTTGNGDLGNTNPQVAVTVKSSGIPAFFSRLWGNTVLSIGATSTAEVYNPSGNTLPVQSQCVKPWLLPNYAPNSTGTNPMFDTTTGQISFAMLPIVDYDYSVQLASNCLLTGCSAPYAPAVGSYYPLQLNAGGFSSTPTTCTAGACEYEQNIASCSSAPIACGSQVTIETTADGCLGSPSTYAPTNDAGTQCLIHATASGLGAGQDCMGLDAAHCGTVATPPPATQFFAGDQNPLKVDGVNLGDLISTSSSVVTIPIFQPPVINNQATVIGFIQGFVTQYGYYVNTLTPGAMHIRIINIAGCPSATGSPVQGDGISPVPVHLIQ
jgi:Flp pilus assembly protein TadG